MSIMLNSLAKMTDGDDYQSDDYSDEINRKSTDSFDDNGLRRTPSNLNNYSILPPIKPTSTKDIKQLQEKYQALEDKEETSSDAKLDDAYLKMKRLDKALEEAFEKEKQVKIETMSLMKKLRAEMQSMSLALNVDPNDSSHAQTNLKRFLALDDEILKFDGGNIIDDDQTNAEPIFKTQLDDPLGESNHSRISSKERRNSNTNNSQSSSLSNRKKTTGATLPSTKSKIPEKDFIKRNIQLAKELGGTWALTDDEKQRLNELLAEDDDQTTIALPNEKTLGYSPSIDQTRRLKEIDELLEKEYYNPLLNHQLRRHGGDTEIDYGDWRQTNRAEDEENEMAENRFGEIVLKETRLQREHMQRLKHIDSKLERMHQTNTEEKIEAILTDEQLNQLLGQCAVDEMKQRFSLINRDRQEIDMGDLSDFTLTSYVENSQGPLITDEIIQLLINEARQEGIIMRDAHEAENEDTDFPSQQSEPLSFTPAIDRPISVTSTSSRISH